MTSSQGKVARVCRSALGSVEVDDLDEAVQAFETQGLPQLQGGRIITGDYAGTRYAYIDTTKALGTVLELVKWPSSA